MDVPRFHHTAMKAACEYFDLHGFVVFGSLVPAQVLESLERGYRELARIYLGRARGREVSRGESSAGSFISDAVLEMESIDHAWVAELYDVSAMSPELLRLVTDPSMTDAATCLMGGAASLYPFTNRIRIDPPSDERRTYGWHQETFYTIPRSHFVQSWAPMFSPTTTGNGTITVADGSHRLGIPAQDWIEPPGRAVQIIVDSTALEAFSTIHVEMHVGEMLFFSSRLSHKSGVNSSDSVRFSLVGMYHDVSYRGFRVPTISYNYRGETPREYFDSTFPGSYGAPGLE